MQFLITAIVVVILLVGVVSPCPSVCKCTDTSDGVFVYCYKRGLESIPTDLPDNTFKLYLYSNKITSVKSDTFNNLMNLKELWLYSNDISVIEDNAFNNLPNLQYLSLHSNDISVIEEKTFNNLPNLQYLSLHSNDISVIEDKTFNNLPNLQYLRLQYNDISVIEDNAFNNLPNLQSLLMSNNPILLVSEKAFENLPELTSLEVDMHCGECRNILFWRWLKRNQKFSNSITCYEYGGKIRSKLQPNNITDCFTAPKTAVDYTAVYTGVGSCIVTALVAVIIVATLRYRRKTANEYANAIIGAQNTEPNYDVVQYHPYDTIET